MALMVAKSLIPLIGQLSDMEKEVQGTTMSLSTFMAEHNHNMERRTNNGYHQGSKAAMLLSNTMQALLDISQTIEFEDELSKYLGNSDASFDILEIVLDSKREKALKQFIAIVAGESTNNIEEAQAIGEVTIRRAAYKGTTVITENFIDKIGGEGQYDAIGGNTYNEIMSSSWNEIFSKDNQYKSRIMGACFAYLSPCDNFSQGAYFWNATSQKEEKNIGFNWRQYKNGTFCISTVVGGTTFFEYSNSKKHWP